MKFFITLLKNIFFLLIFVSIACTSKHNGKISSPIILVKESTPLYTILVDPNILPLDKGSNIIENSERGVIAYDSIGEQREAINTLLFYVNQISGCNLKVEPFKKNSHGCYIGLTSNYPWNKKNIEHLGEEGFQIGKEGENIFIVADNSLGIRHAVNTILMDQGCRWFFPGKEWEEIPKSQTITLFPSIQIPSFDMGRIIWYGYGTYEKPALDKKNWDYHNRMGAPVFINIGHTNYDIDFVKDFKLHPEWFALVDGQRTATKLCYSHPEVIERMTQYALKMAKNGASSVSLSPADGRGFCECDLCFGTAQGGEIKKEGGTFFATRPDGVLVCTVSETLFNAINQVANVMAEKYPEVLLGCYGYSSYSHPPSFKLHKNIFVQTTTHYRRTPLNLSEQLELWGSRCNQVGIRGYWSVYQWDWDNPLLDIYLPEIIQKDLKFYHKHNAKAFVTEASNNWGPRGLNYYIGSQLLWNVNVNIKEVIKDFYEKAFGPAAESMERYYSHWYGRGVMVLDTLPSNQNSLLDIKSDFDEFGAYDPKQFLASKSALRDAYKDLDEASKLVADIPKYQKRIDQLRMYIYYLRLRDEVWDTTSTNNVEAKIEAIKKETTFGAKLTNTNMIHTKPLLGNAFMRLFKYYEPILKDIPESQQRESGWRLPIEIPPDYAELEQLWEEGKKYFGIE